MRRLDKELRELDPVDADAPEPNGEQLLERIVAESCPPVRKPPRRRLLELAPVGLAATALAAVLLVAGLGRGADDDREVPPPADEVPTAVDPDSILHYTQRWTMEGSGPATEVDTREVWQAGNGSRERVVYRPGDTATFEYSEQVTTRHAARAFTEDGGPPTIVEYDSPAYGSPSAPAAYGLRPDVGDPRTLPARAAARERGVQRLDAATVRDVPVERFRVGACSRTRDSVDASAAPTGAVIVSLARDTLLPIRVEPLPCEATKGALSEAANVPRATTDYVSFEVLPPTEENRRLLEMAHHPGARVVSGDAIDRAEDRAESNPSALPTATPTPASR